MPIEHGSQSCPSCGYPAHAGHAPSCPARRPKAESVDGSDAVEAKTAQILSPEDRATFRRLLESVGGKEKLFDPKGKFLHTTDNLSFTEMLGSGAIITDDVFPGGKQRTPGASFTDGNFPEAMSFQLLYDNIPGGGKEKRLSSEKYAQAIGGSLAEDFVGYFWKNHPEDAKPYLAQLANKIPVEKLASLGVGTDRLVTTEEQALAISKYFVPRGRGDYGVTLVYDGNKGDEIGIEDRGTAGLQKFFEKRSFKPGGVPLSEASAILVPESRIAEVRQELATRGLSHIDVRPSEEMEAQRILQKIR